MPDTILSSPCRAQDPQTCPYHGPELRATVLLQQGDYDGALRELQERDRNKTYHRQVEAFMQSSVEPMTETKIGVHTSHCCNLHGCKYGDKDCPVAAGLRAQEYACEMCGFEIEEYEQRYGQLQTRHLNLLSVDPFGCACDACASGAHLPEDMWRGTADSGDLRNMLYQDIANNTGQTLTAVLESGTYDRQGAQRLQNILNGTDVPTPVVDEWGL